jgi:hypothetical protein
MRKRERLKVYICRLGIGYAMKMDGSHARWRKCVENNSFRIPPQQQK